MNAKRNMTSNVNMFIGVYSLIAVSSYTQMLLKETKEVMHREEPLMTNRCHSAIDFH
jgi:hypothetical protein